MRYSSCWPELDIKLAQDFGKVGIIIDKESSLLYGRIVGRTVHGLPLLCWYGGKYRRASSEARRDGTALNELLTCMSLYIHPSCTWSTHCVYVLPTTCILSPTVGTVNAVPELLHKVLTLCFGPYVGELQCHRCVSHHHQLKDSNDLHRHEKMGPIYLGRTTCSCPVPGSPSYALSVSRAHGQYVSRLQI